MSVCNAFVAPDIAFVGQDMHGGEKGVLEAVTAPRARNPILYPPTEGADYQTCWTCANGERVADAGRDASVCYVHRFVERYPHEPNECDEWLAR